MANKDSAYDVVKLYLLDIDYCYREFLKYLASKGSPDLASEIFKIYTSNEKSEHNYFQKLNYLKNGISDIANNNFRLKLIYKNIFSEFESKTIDDINGLYVTLIKIEYNTIQFLNSYFRSFPYINIKHLLEKIINEKKQYIIKLKAYKSA